MTNKYKFYMDDKVYEIPDYNKLKNHLETDDTYKYAFFKDITVLYNVKNVLDLYVELGLVVAKGKDIVADEHIALVRRLREDFPEIENYIEEIKTK